MKTRLEKLGITEEQIHIFDEIDSTNLAAVRRAKERASRGTEIFLARSQSAGRGRLGRSFVSQTSAGVYLSILIPKESYSANSLTAHTAAALAMTLDSSLGTKTQIKWVNDIYLSGKKLAGILVEAVTSTDGKITDFVIGMGINVYKNAITDEISDIATSLEDCGFSVKSIDCLAYEIAVGFIERVLLRLDPKSLLSEYKKRSLIDGQAIEVMPVGHEPYEALAIGINDDFTLKIALPDGKTASLSSGEVKTRIKR